MGKIPDQVRDASYVYRDSAQTQVRPLHAKLNKITEKSMTYRISVQTGIHANMSEMVSSLRGKSLDFNFCECVPDLIRDLFAVCTRV